MSTRSAIIAKTENGYAGIYCHFDGYESGVGKTLLAHYRDPQKVAELIELGDISSLGERVSPIGAHSYDSPEKGTTVAYGRDRGEETEVFLAESQIEVEKYFEGAHDGYVYVFDGSLWKLNGSEFGSK